MFNNARQHKFNIMLYEIQLDVLLLYNMYIRSSNCLIIPVNSHSCFGLLDARILCNCLILF